MCLAAFFVSNWWFARQGMEERVEKADPGLKPWIFALPALCDLVGTSLMNVGLVFTYASVFQMLRGSVVIFTGIFSVIFLKRTLYAFHWFGMFLVLAGLTCVGVASVVQSSSDSNASNPLLGDILVICAQFVAAIQMVVEEKVRVLKETLKPCYPIVEYGPYQLKSSFLLLLVLVLVLASCFLLLSFFLSFSVPSFWISITFLLYKLLVVKVLLVLVTVSSY